jgi:hypothetical protein
MNILKKITKNEKKLQRFAGVNFGQLSLLVKRIAPLWKEAEKKRLNREDRRRKIGGGRTYKLKTVKEKVLTVLLYYKQYITQELLGFLVGLDQGPISRLLSKMLPLIEEAADPELKTFLENAKKTTHQKIRTLEEYFAAYPELRDVATDAMEQKCFRSQDNETQKKHYSGKSKQHTIKTQISVGVHGQILDVTQSYPGSVHDKTVIDTEKTIEKFDKCVPHRFDSGYQGVKVDHPDHYLIIPTKKKKKQELSDLEKELNKANSKLRIKVENAFCRVQQFKIAATTFRQPLKKYNQTFRNVAALVNFKLQNPAFSV